jgi:hypothetical protein
LLLTGKSYGLIKAMRRDLLDAQACVKWAEAKFKSFDKRLDRWRYRNMDVTVEDLEPHSERKIVLAGAKGRLPRHLNVEVGLYIHALRSSLDILASAIAMRHRDRIARPDRAYFPVATSRQKFIDGDFKGAEFIKGLPNRDRTIFESLDPYQGGHQTLWALHDLDNTRKHRNLLTAYLKPGGIAFRSDVPIAQYITYPTNFEVRVHGKTVVAFISKSAPKCEIEIVSEIALDEPTAGIGTRPVIETLNNFAALAKTIIKAFDYR